MFSEYLHHVCRAALDVLSPAVAGDFLACDLVQIDRKEFDFQAVAAAHYTQGPLRRLVVGCEQRLAASLAQKWNPVSTVTPVSGLQSFCERLQVRLGAEASFATLGGQTFLVHDSDQFRVFCDGARNFHFRVALAEGRLDLLLDMAPRNLGCTWLDTTLHAAAHDLTGGGTGEAVAEPAVVERIMVYLCESGADVQVKVTGIGGRLELMPATFIQGGLDRQNRALTLTCARRPGVLDEHETPAEVDLVFILQEKLLECTCPVIEQQPGVLDDDIALPVLRLGFPRGVAYGQRRGAFRMTPSTRITGTIQRMSAPEANLGLVRGRIPMEVEDISYTGVRLSLAANAILSGFKGGAPVECRFQLPSPTGPVTVTGLVRRLSMYSEGKLQRGANLGVEFDATIGQTEEGLEAIRRYIRSCFGSPTDGGVSLEPCCRS